jgi:hypothetical protein
VASAYSRRPYDFTIVHSPAYRDLVTKKYTLEFLMNRNTKFCARKKTQNFQCRSGYAGAGRRKVFGRSTPRRSKLLGDVPSKGFPNFPTSDPGNFESFRLSKLAQASISNLPRSPPIDASHGSKLDFHILRSPKYKGPI